jgi:hypothetical protein
LKTPPEWRAAIERGDVQIDRYIPRDLPEERGWAFLLDVSRSMRVWLEDAVCHSIIKSVEACISRSRYANQEANSSSEDGKMGGMPGSQI